MTKFFKNKACVTVFSLIICVALTCCIGIQAIASNSPQSVTLTVDYDGEPIQDNFIGLGYNLWTHDLSKNSTSIGMTLPHADLNSKRVATQNAGTVRMMFWPETAMFLDDEDKGEAKWTAGILNTESQDFKATIHALKMFQDAGTDVFLGWGYTNSTAIWDWYTIKGVYSPNRSAPRDLDSFARNLRIFLEYCWDNGIYNITSIHLHNEVNYDEFDVLGDKRIYHAKAIELIDKELKSSTKYPELRESVKISGADVSIGAGFEGDWGADSGYAKSSGGILEYAYKNQVQTGIADLLDVHYYYSTDGYAHDITSFKKITADILKHVPDVWITEFSAPIYSATTYDKLNTEEKKEAVRSEKFNYSYASAYSALANSGVENALLWYGYGGITTVGNWHPKFRFYHDPEGKESYYEGVCFWNLPVDRGEGYGVDAISQTYGNVSLMTRYSPKSSQILKSTSSSEDVNIAVFETKYTDTQGALKPVAEQDITYMVEVSGESAIDLSLNLGEYAGRTDLKKYVYQYPEDYDNNFSDADDDGTTIDANALIPGSVDPADANYFSVDNGTLKDSFDDTHYLVIYSTIDECPQIYFENAGDVQIEVAEGNLEAIEFSQIKSRGINGTDVDEDEVVWTINSAYDAATETNISENINKAEITPAGEVKLTANAKEGDWISVKVASSDEDLAAVGGYTIALIKVVAPAATS